MFQERDRGVHIAKVLDIESYGERKYRISQTRRIDGVSHLLHSSCQSKYGYGLRFLIPFLGNVSSFVPLALVSRFVKPLFKSLDKLEAIYILQMSRRGHTFKDNLDCPDISIEIVPVAF